MVVSSGTGRGDAVERRADIPRDRDLAAPPRSDARIFRGRGDAAGYIPRTGRAATPALLEEI